MQLQVEFFGCLLVEFPSQERGKLFSLGHLMSFAEREVLDGNLQNSRCWLQAVRPIAVAVQNSKAACRPYLLGQGCKLITPCLHSLSAALDDQFRFGEIQRIDIPQVGEKQQVGKRVLHGSLLLCEQEDCLHRHRRKAFQFFIGLKLQGIHIAGDDDIGSQRPGESDGQVVHHASIHHQPILLIGVWGKYQGDGYAASDGADQGPRFVYDTLSG